MTELDIQGHSEDGKILYYSQINRVYDKVWKSRYFQLFSISSIFFFAYGEWMEFLTKDLI